MSKEKLIDAALQEYSLHGYHGATMKNIASEVGIKPASIYFFFENKEKLFIAAFQQLLDNHQKEMERIFTESQGKEVSQICISMIHGLVAHHKGDERGTMAYISLVNTPIPEIKKYLQKHMLNFNNWMKQSFKDLLQSNYSSITEVEIDSVIKQYVLLANGVFWSINLYEGETFDDQVRIAENFIHNIFSELNNRCKS
ncbi:AcrR family transcriptional regulator [Virgibacillus halotolerans]|uniref:TetR/AcrR family transcriptional regulator n=1 Tax=Virgibacillus halotolerans TaxID=1071053 RepID=UPI001961970D|nr:TetR/AcrR family transcriptional regulator [Virgibacillus halotolerans]MBM7599182.1 AcrR family transcriptional regulator [Virgibacillus halotolerans]